MATKSVAVRDGCKEEMAFDLCSERVERGDEFPGTEEFKQTQKSVLPDVYSRDGKKSLTVYWARGTERGMRPAVWSAADLGYWLIRHSIVAQEHYKCWPNVSSRLTTIQAHNLVVTENL